MIKCLMCNKPITSFAYIDSETKEGLEELKNHLKKNGIPITYNFSGIKSGIIFCQNKIGEFKVTEVCHSCIISIMGKNSEKKDGEK